MRQTPNAFKNVNPYFLTNPIGIDLIVDALQRKLDDEFNWLEKSFGRAIKAGTTDDEGNEKEYPAMFIEDGKDLTNMLKIDNYDAYSFFYAEDEEELIEDDEYNQWIANRLQRTLHLIVWLDLKRVDPAQVENYTEQVKQDIWKAIGETLYPCDTSAEIVAVFDEPDNIFEDFTFDFVQSQNMLYPKVGLRFELLACYNNDIDGYGTPINQQVTAFAYSNNGQNINAVDPFASMIANISPSQRFLFVLNPIDVLPSFVSLSQSDGSITDNGGIKSVGVYEFSVIALVNSHIAACNLITITVT